MKKMVEQKSVKNSKVDKDIGSRREKRRQAILDAANTLFIEKGYGTTSLTDIVKKSGGSLATLYDLFGGKEGLFHAMVEVKCQEFVEFLYGEEVTDSSLDVALRKIGEHFFRSILEENGLAFFILVISEVKHFPEVGQAFYEAGPKTVETILADYFSKQSKLGHLRIAEPVEAAKTFLSLIIGQYQTELLCGNSARMTRSQIEKHLNQSIKNFLKIYSTEPQMT